MKMITVFLPHAMIEEIDELVKAKLYPNRAELIRIAVRDVPKQEKEWSNLQGKSGRYGKAIKDLKDEDNERVG